MPNSTIVENLKQHVEAVINDQLPSAADRIRALVELRDHVVRLLDEQE
jgi:hypothetical protein